MITSNYSDCDYCPYKNGLHLDPEFYKIRNSPLSAETNGSKTLLVFQSPGLDEWRNGRPISSTNNRSAAYKIESAFKALQKTRKDFDITNAVQCYTGKCSNKDTTKPRDLGVRKAASKICAKRLQDLIEFNGYDNLVVFGSVARNSMKIIDIPQNIKVIFSKHPSARGVSIESIARLLKIDGKP
jgi:uracil-DNA glycosylase